MRSSKASATATSFTLAFVLRMFSAAPDPRPPAPMRATRSRSLPAAWAARDILKLAVAAVMPASAERLRNSRREAVRNGIVLGRVGFVSLMEGTFPVRWGSE